MKSLSELMRSIDAYALCRDPTEAKALRKAIYGDLKTSFRDTTRLDAIELLGSQRGGLLIYDPSRYSATEDTSGLSLTPGVHGRTLRQAIDDCVQNVELPA